MRKHIPSGYGYVIVSPYEDFNKDVKIYRGESAAEHFVNSLDEDYKSFQKKLEKVEDMIFTEKDEADFKSNDTCYICKKPFTFIENGQKVRDHDHLTGSYRGAAHSNSNLNMRQSQKMIIYMHNSKG